MSVKKYLDYIALHEQKTRTIGFRARAIEEAKQNKTLAQLSIYNDGFAVETMRSLDAPLFSIVTESSINCKESISQYDTLLISLFVTRLIDFAKSNIFFCSISIINIFQFLLCKTNI